MTRRDRRGLYLAIAALVATALVLLAATGPSTEREMSGLIRRSGGACLQLERWGLFGWAAVGQSHDVNDIRDGVWHPPHERPPCAEGIPTQTYLVRLPVDSPNGDYRLCGLADDRACLEFRRVDFEPGPPGP